MKQSTFDAIVWNMNAYGDRRLPSDYLLLHKSRVHNIQDVPQFKGQSYDFFRCLGDLNVFAITKSVQAQDDFDAIAEEYGLVTRDIGDFLKKTL